MNKPTGQGGLDMRHEYTIWRDGNIYMATEDIEAAVAIANAIKRFHDEVAVIDENGRDRWFWRKGF